MRRIWLISALLMLCAIAVVCATRVACMVSSDGGSVVPIGINHSPPYAIVDADGLPGGFSFEVLNEAARRAGIRLHWVVCPEGAERALKSGKVDVWHVLTDLPDRRKWAKYTDPWLRDQYVIAAPGNSPVRSAMDAAGRRVSYANDVFQERLARQFFFRSTLLPEPLANELRDLCRGEADATFIEMKHLVAHLLKRPPGCESFPIRIIPLDGAGYPLAIGATEPGFAAARKLRAEITNMAQDGTLDYLQGKWLVNTSDETRVVNELTEARQRSRLFRYCAAILGALVVVLGILIYRERLTRHAIKSSYEFAAAALDAAGGLMFIADRNGRFVRFNRACERATGLTLKDVKGKTSWDMFVPSDERPQVLSMFEQLAAGATYTNHEHHWRTSEGLRLFSWSNTTLLNNAGRVDFIIATGIDISNREAAEEKLGYEATHDALTNLPNRRHFLRELEIAILETRSGSGNFSLALADLDHFKIINDTYGHESGDDVLVYLAHVLRGELRAGDLVGRLGGDEFCLLIRNSSAESVVGRIKEQLMDHEFHSAAGKTFHAAVTFGLAAWSCAMQQPADAIRAADQDLYLAKSRCLSRKTGMESEMTALEAELAVKHPFLEPMPSANSRIPPENLEMGHPSRWGIRR